MTLLRTPRSAERDRESDLDDGAFLEDQDFAIEYEFEETLAVDPVDAQIVEYLDDELDDAKKSEFEEKMKNDPALRERVEQERVAWNALDFLDDEEESNERDLVESTVEALNSQTRAELDATRAAIKRSTRRVNLAVALAAIALAALGFYIADVVSPDPALSRRADAPVVRRLAQLEAVGNFDYLRALADDKELADAWRKLDESSFFPTENSGEGVEEPDFEILEGDGVFQSMQRRFEALDGKERKRLRNLYQKIDDAPDRNKLFDVLEDYQTWLASAPGDLRESLDGLPNDRKIERLVKSINEEVERREAFRDVWKSKQTARESNARAIREMWESFKSSRAAELVMNGGKKTEDELRREFVKGRSLDKLVEKLPIEDRFYIKTRANPEMQKWFLVNSALFPTQNVAQESSQTFRARRYRSQQEEQTILADQLRKLEGKDRDEIASAPPKQALAKLKADAGIETNGRRQYRRAWGARYSQFDRGRGVQPSFGGFGANSYPFGFPSSNGGSVKNAPTVAPPSFDAADENKSGDKGERP